MFVSVAGKQITCSTGEALAHDVNEIDVVIADFDEGRDIGQQLFRGPYPSDDKAVGAKYENLPAFDRMYISRPEAALSGGKGYVQTELYIDRAHLVIYSQDAALRQALREHIAGSGQGCRAADVLRRMFGHIFSGDTVGLNKMEDCLAGLESTVIEDEGPIADMSKNLLSVRKTLLTLKRYYAAMFDMLEDLEENLNAIFTKDEIKHFRIHTNKASRLLGEIDHLQEYATQVREAYQGQLDIQQNRVMQFFTVITAIFLPLTLLAGWYGMNFNMPEYGYPFSYPVLIAVSAVTVIALLLYFKKKKWF